MKEKQNKNNYIERCGLCKKEKVNCYNSTLFFRKYHGIDCMDFEGLVCCECIAKIEGDER